MPTMRPLFALTVAAVMPFALAAQAHAQARTGTGGGPDSTVTAPNTATTGRTKPPGSATGAENSGAAASASRRERTPMERKDDQIQNGICIGCGAK